MIDLFFAAIFYMCTYIVWISQNNHRLPQFIYASDTCLFAVYVSLKAQSPNIPRENTNRKITSVKLPPNTFSRVMLWLALEVLAKRKWSATV